MACPRPGPAIGKARGSLPRPQISELKGPLKAAFWICSFTSHFQVRTRGLAPPPGCGCILRMGARFPLALCTGQCRDAGVPGSP